MSNDVTNIDFNMSNYLCNSMPVLNDYFYYYIIIFIILIIIILVSYFTYYWIYNRKKHVTFQDKLDVCYGDNCRQN